MNPGDKVRYIRRDYPLYDKVGTLVKWESHPFGQPYAVVKFSEGVGNLNVDPWDLEPEESGTCDDPITTGRRFKQDHTCTLPANHKGGHLCNVCGHTWEDDTPSLKLIPKYAALYPDPILDKEVPNEGS